MANGVLPLPKFFPLLQEICGSIPQGLPKQLSGLGLGIPGVQGWPYLSLAAFGAQLPLRASSQLVLCHVFPAIREVVCVPDRRQCVCLYVCPCKHCFCLFCARKRFSPLRGFGDSWGGEGLLCPLVSHREVSQGTCVALGLYPRYTLSSLQLSSCCVTGHSLLMFVQATSLCYTGCGPCAGSKLWGYGLAPACNQ